MIRKTVVLVGSGLALLAALLLFRRIPERTVASAPLKAVLPVEPSEDTPPIDALTASPPEVEDMTPPPDTSPTSEEPQARKVLAGLGLAVIVFGAIVGVLAAFILLVGPSDEPESRQAALPSPTATASVAAGAVAAESATEAPAPETLAAPAEGADVARIVMPSLEIDAPIITLGVDPDGTMQAPDNPTDVAWYSFSARPGEVSNIVMAGHLDYVNYGPAVFYRIKDARLGEELQLVLMDGSVARYRVLDVTAYDEATAPVQDIVGPTDGEVVTLITCGGSFDPLSREYDKRVVLRAERIADTALGN